MSVASTAIRRLLSGTSRGFLPGGKGGSSVLASKRLVQGRFLSNAASVHAPTRFVEGLTKIKTPSWGCYNGFQTRGFLSVVEETTLPKIYQEKRVIGYSPEQLYNVVAAVDLYEDFLPWCQRSQILRRHGDGSFDAELKIGFNFFVEKYISHVELKKSDRVKTVVSESGLFDHLINVWDFSPGPHPGTCNLYFYVDFKFKSALYSQVSCVFFSEVASCLVSSFTDRCRLLYGPEKRVIESSYKQPATS